MFAFTLIHLRRVCRCAWPLLVLAFISGCACHAARHGGGELLRDYSAYNNTDRQILPQDYIAYLKQNRFTNGELDHLPDCALILHYADMPKFLRSVGYATNDWTAIATGTTDPIVLYVVRPPGQPGFIINQGLPGAGGIATETAELGALGVRRVVHIGTSGLLGDSVPTDDLVVSTGAYKDGAAVLLSDYQDGRVEPIAQPDAALSAKLMQALQKAQLPFREAIGFTTPIFYFQPAGWIRSLLNGKPFDRLGRPEYLEMEEAPFYETCHRLGIQGASLTVGSDRYLLAGGELQHIYLGDTDTAIARAFQATVQALVGADR